MSGTNGAPNGERLCAKRGDPDIRRANRRTSRNAVREWTAPRESQLGDDEFAADDLDLLLGQRHGGRATLRRAGGEIERTGVTAAVDLAAVAVGQDAGLVGADRTERVVLALLGLGDHDL